jgi:hypothetical protein
MRQKYWILAACMVMAHINLAYCDELTIQFSELEKFLGKPVPANAQRIDINEWRIELFENHILAQDIILMTEDNLVASAGYGFISDSANQLAILRGNLINTLENERKSLTKVNDILFWVISPGTLCTKPLYITLSNINLINPSVEMYNFYVFASIAAFLQ